MNTIIFLKINSLAGQNAWFDQLMVFSADKLGYIIVGLVIVVCLLNTKKYKEILILSFGSAMAARFGIVVLIRLFYYHPRPFLALQNVRQLLDHNTDSSFPSGHMAFYFAMAMVLYRYDKKAGITAFALSGLMGFARIFVGIHWPLDIVIGAVVGLTVAYLLCRISYAVRNT